MVLFELCYSVGEVCEVCFVAGEDEVDGEVFDFVEAFKVVVEWVSFLPCV